MQIRAERWLVGALVAVVIVGAGFRWKHGPTEPVVQRANAMPAPMPAAGPALPIPVQAPDAVPVSASIVDDGLPLGIQVERLLATRDPQHAYSAYFLILACTSFNRHHDLKLYDDKLRVQRDMNAGERQHMTRMCAGMTERERQARLDHLAIAVKAGVPGAAWTFAAEGPFGDPSALQTRPDDPLVQTWKATATTQLTHAAEAGDITTLLVWGIQNLNGSDLTGKNPVLGYGYLLAFGFIQADRFGPDNPGAQAYKDGSAVMNAMAGSLTPEQRAAAVAAGRRVADKVKGRR